MAHLFPLGQTVVTPAALDLLRAHGASSDTLLRRHSAGDWGDISPNDRGLNDQAVRDGSRIFSVYEIAPEVKVLIITEAEDDDGERAATTILCPEDY
jgi:hypothetical protein